MEWYTADSWRMVSRNWCLSYKFLQLSSTQTEAWWNLADAIKDPAGFISYHVPKAEKTLVIAFYGFEGIICFFVRLIVSPRPSNLHFHLAFIFHLSVLLRALLYDCWIPKVRIIERNTIPKRDIASYESEVLRWLVRTFLLVAFLPHLQVLSCWDYFEWLVDHPSSVSRSADAKTRFHGVEWKIS